MMSVRKPASGCYPRRRSRISLWRCFQGSMSNQSGMIMILSAPDAQKTVPCQTAVHVVQVFTNAVLKFGVVFFYNYGLCPMCCWPGSERLRNLPSGSIGIED